jgi:hypothetical protein
MTLVIKEHWAGFFSCSCLRLDQIINYCHHKNQTPERIINNKSFLWYNSNTSHDIVPDFFITTNEIISYEKKVECNFGEAQFMKYDKLPLVDIYPYVKKFFSPSEKVRLIKKKLIEKYSIDLANSCVLFLRGNDKAKECTIPAYTEYITKATAILEQTPTIKFIIQSDELEFINRMKSKFPNNTIFYEEIRVIAKDTTKTVDNHGQTPENNYKYALNFLAIVLIMAECKYVVCNSGNISLWIALFRENLENFIQL